MLLVVNIMLSVYRKQCLFFSQIFGKISALFKNDEHSSGNLVLLALEETYNTPPYDRRNVTWSAFIKIDPDIEFLIF